MPGRSFAPSERFVTEVANRKLKPAYVFVAADARRIEMQDRDRYERIKETLGQYCGWVELARVDESDGMRWVMEKAQQEQVKVEQDAARELIDALGADMMLVSNELEKLVLYV